MIVIKIGLFYIYNIYNTLWKYASIEEFVKIIVVNIIGNIISFIIFTMIESTLYFHLVLIMFFLDMILTGGTRIVYRIARRLKNCRVITVDSNNMLIVGAGDGGVTIMKEYKNNDGLDSKLVGFIDDDPRKHGKYLNGFKVLGKVSDIGLIVKEKNVNEIVIAMPSASKERMKEIINACQNTQCKIRILPNLAELEDAKYFTKQIREVRIEDLLGREAVDLQSEEICGYLEHKKVLVTGGGGSIGSELCRQIAKLNPRELIVLDIYENNAYDLQNEIKKKYPNLQLKVIIASVRDKRRIEEILFDHRPQVVFHAAAHKHVPLMEDNPEEAIKNNVFGTLNVAQASDKYGVENFVMISTDKAVNPTNIMGATKRLCEMVIQSIDKVSKTEFVAVRFGNVLGSNGSVIPLFKKQIAEGGPVLVTHRDIIRYFMTIPEASQLVIQAGAMARGGEIFVLDMGDPVKILDLAKDLIRLSGFEPEKDISIEIVGLRPGEKLYEELLLDEEDIKSTKHPKILIGKPVDVDYQFILRRISLLKDAIEDSRSDIKKLMMTIVPTYKPIVYNDSTDVKLQDKIAITKEGD